MLEPIALVTGACGLVGSDACLHFSRNGFRVVGIDDNHRAVFFGPEGDTAWTLNRLRKEVPAYRHEALDIRDRQGLTALVREIRPDLILHAAGQPSHDRAASIPVLDFEVNALGTLNLLEAARQHCPETPLVYMSTNKLYGDSPNRLPLEETAVRWEFAGERRGRGIGEELSIDQCMHSVFGASKTAADVMVQEYGRYYNLPTCCLRAGCITGPNHAGVELHGFLSYLVKSTLEGREYRVFGYQGKQVRDNIHSEDVARFVLEFRKAPRAGEVYNIGGGFENSCSILEAFRMVEEVSGCRVAWRYLDQNRLGDHICYYSDLGKLRSHYPAWRLEKSLRTIFEEMVAAWRERLAGAVA